MSTDNNDNECHLNSYNENNQTDPKKSSDNCGKLHVASLIDSEISDENMRNNVHNDDISHEHNITQIKLNNESLCEHDSKNKSQLTAYYIKVSAVIACVLAAIGVSLIWHDNLLSMLFTIAMPLFALNIISFFKKQLKSDNNYKFFNLVVELPKSNILYFILGYIFSVVYLIEVEMDTVFKFAYIDYVVYFMSIPSILYMIIQSVMIDEKTEMKRDERNSRIEKENEEYASKKNAEHQVSVDKLSSRYKICAAYYSMSSLKRYYIKQAVMQLFFIVLFFFFIILDVTIFSSSLFLIFCISGAGFINKDKVIYNSNGKLKDLTDLAAKSAIISNIVISIIFAILMKTSVEIAKSIVIIVMLIPSVICSMINWIIINDKDFSPTSTQSILDAGDLADSANMQNEINEAGGEEIVNDDSVTINDDGEPINDIDNSETDIDNTEIDIDDSKTIDDKKINKSNK